MHTQTWKEGIQQWLHDAGDLLWHPDTMYGALAASSIAPIVAAVNQGEYAALVALTGIVGGVGGNLIANQVQNWQDKSDEELSAELGTLAADDPAWRETIDTLIVELETPRIFQAITAVTDTVFQTERLRYRRHRQRFRLHTRSFRLANQLLERLLQTWHQIPPRALRCV